MAMEIEKQFVLKAPVDAVWAFLTDPHRVASCLPGAAITEQTDERSYTGTITVKVGPVSSSYKGKLHFERLDAAAHEADIVASGQDVRGKGGADMRMSSRVVEQAPGETQVTVRSSVNVTGILAQFGRGMIQDVSDAMFDQFTTAMRQQLEQPAGAGGAPGAEDTAGAAGAASPAPAPQALDAVSLGTKIAGRQLRRVVARPGFWIVVAVIAVVIWLLVR